MSNEKIYATPNIPTPNRPVIFDAALCTGCNLCAEVCVMDIYIPNPDKKSPPIIMYPDECIYCGNCVDDCPTDGAISLNLPLMQRVRWKRKDTGEHYRV